jgi:hypothetical protein
MDLPWYTLARKFKEVRGLTLQRFIREARVEAAKALIARGARMDEVATAVGVRNLYELVTAVDRTRPIDARPLVDGAEVRRRRLALGMTQVALAAAARLNTAQHLVVIETGKPGRRNPLHVSGLARALGCPPQALLATTTPPRKGRAG